MLQNADLVRFGGHDGRFDKALAVNVNVFWTTGAERECAVLRRGAAARGVLVLVFGGAEHEGARNVGPRSATTLGRSGLSPTSSPHPSDTMVGVAARVRPVNA